MSVPWIGREEISTLRKDVETDLREARMRDRPLEETKLRQIHASLVIAEQLSLCAACLDGILTAIERRS